MLNTYGCNDDDYRDDYDDSDSDSDDYGLW
jgi:hypothetical protein